MNETHPIDTGIREVKPVGPINPPAKPGILSKISEKIPRKVKDVFNRFYSNKKIFWPVVISFGLVFLIIILGLIFGTKGAASITAPKKTPVPEIQATPEASPSGDILTVTENQLKDLNREINALDIGQSKLKLPAINYNISF